MDQFSAAKSYYLVTLLCATQNIRKFFQFEI